MRYALASLVLTTLLAACGSPSNDEAMFPLEQGRSWSYRTVTTLGDVGTAPSRESLTLTVRGSDAIEGAPAWRRRSSSGVEYWLRSDATGIFRVASKGPLDRDPLIDATPRYVLRKPFVVGTQWQANTTSYVLQRRNEFPRELRHLTRYKTLPMSYRIDAVDERVVTPAGEFKDCLRVLGQAEIRLYVDEAFAWRDVPLITREWYCPGVGFARLERNEPSPTKFILGGTVTMELTAWR